MKKAPMISLLGNILWILTGGFFSALYYYFIGALLYCTIIGIPLARKCFDFARLSLAPFGTQIESDLSLQEIPQVIANVLWLVVFGWNLALLHLGAALALALTIIGIPFAWQHLKLAQMALWPFGTRFIEED